MYVLTETKTKVDEKGEVRRGGKANGFERTDREEKKKGKIQEETGENEARARETKSG